MDTSVSLARWQQDEQAAAGLLPTNVSSQEAIYCSSVKLKNLTLDLPSYVSFSIVASEFFSAWWGCL